MKRTQPTTNPDPDPVENRRDWLLFSGHARMHVWNSGGPIHVPHKRVLQLLIMPWHGDDESWTVYRHQENTRNDGKIVFKKWNTAADKERFQRLEHLEAPGNWDAKTNVTERQLLVPGSWVAALERTVGALSVPPIAGSVRPLARTTKYELSLWRSRQAAEFHWGTTPPKAWQPLARLFNALLRCFRRHADGQPLPPVHEL